MKLIKKLRLYRQLVRSENRAIEINESQNFHLDFCAAELIRYTHAIEKGLSIDNPRLGFGHEKQMIMLDLINELMNSSNPYHVETIKMAVSAIKRYLLYHTEHCYSDEVIKKLESFITQYDACIVESFGGIVNLNADSISFDTNEIKKLFEMRHSIRDFDDTPIEDDKILNALKLAQHAPSACNRQGYRAYILSDEKSKKYAKGLAGIGGFEKSVGRFILITGKISAYRIDEVNQYIVSASMYAAYLTLTLHLYGLGACVVQRPLIWDKEWEKVRVEYDIPYDEQLICLLAIGNLKKNINVPQSHRLAEEVMFKFIQ